MFCKKCGMRLAEGEKVCRKCGEPRESSSYCGGFWGLTGELSKDVTANVPPPQMDGRYAEAVPGASFTPTNMQMQDSYMEDNGWQGLLNERDRVIAELREEVDGLRKQRLIFAIIAGVALAGLLLFGIVSLLGGSKKGGEPQQPDSSIAKTISSEDSSSEMADSSLDATVSGEDGEAAEIPTEGVEPTEGAMEIPTEGVEPTDGAAAIPTEGVEPTDGIAEIPTVGAEPTDGAAEIPTVGAEPTDVAAEIPTVGAEATDVAAEIPTVGAEATEGTVEIQTAGAEITVGPEGRT